MIRTLIILFLIPCVGLHAQSSDNPWTVAAVVGETTATVNRNAGDSPGIGDTVGFFFVIPGLDEKAKKGDGKIIAVTNQNFTVEIDPSVQTGKIASGDKVELVKRGAGAPAMPRPVTTTTPPQAAPEAPANRAEVTVKFWRGLDRYEAGAEAGEPESIYQIALAFHRGIRYKRDPARVAIWLEKASEAGHPIAALQHAVNLIRSGDESGNRKLIAAVDELQRLTNSTSEMKADAAFYLGQCYADGMGVVKDPARSRQMYLLAQKCYQPDADSGDAFDAIQMAIIAKSGLVGPPSETEYFRYSLLAAEQGHPEAMANVADAYALGFGTEQSSAESTKWNAEAAKLDHGAAQIRLGEYFLKDSSAAQHRVVAYAWAALGAQKNFTEGFERIAAVMTVEEKKAGETLADHIQNNIETGNWQ